jgi:hypothetical protein
LTITPEADRTIVDIMANANGSSFQRKICGDYNRHLFWILQESVGTTDRCRWISYVLDSFAEELRRAPHDMDNHWRSASLNSLLVRAFYGIEDDKPKKIESHASLELSVDSPGVDDWGNFYMELDVISAKYNERWDRMGRPSMNAAKRSTQSSDIHRSKKGAGKKGAWARNVHD